MLQFGGKDSKRHFTVVIDRGGKGGTNVPPKEHGLYVSSTPSSAARKAVTKLCTANKSKKVEFHIREITQGSKKKTYGPYTGYIEKLKEPIELKGRVIQYKPVAKLSGKVSKKMKGGMLWPEMNPVDDSDSDNFLIATIEYNPPETNNNIHLLHFDDPKYLEYLNQQQEDEYLGQAIGGLDKLDGPKSENDTLCYIKQNEDQNNGRRTSFNIYVKSFIGYNIKPLLQDDGYRAQKTIRILKNLYERCKKSGYCTFNFIFRPNPFVLSNSYNIKTRKKLTDLLELKIKGNTHNQIFESNDGEFSNWNN